ncbi:MAG: hypothetical protein EB127_20815 [Alphaproteobacteria bacterium]|nr:hypothetical protein [Alphaproteobacteria bacterium]
MKPVCKIDNCGNKEWYLNGLYHREDGPAFEGFAGGKAWYLNGYLHRKDGPAVDDQYNGELYWYINGKLHRIDGPAIERTNGNNHYFLNGVEYSFKEWDRLRKLPWLL